MGVDRVEQSGANTEDEWAEEEEWPIATDALDANAAIKVCNAMSLEALTEMMPPPSPAPTTILNMKGRMSRPVGRSAVTL
jgi:hypothetical protein